MKKNRALVFAPALVALLALGPALSGARPSAAAQQPNPPECLEKCALELEMCLALADNPRRCMSVYHGCTVRCRR